MAEEHGVSLGGHLTNRAPSGVELLRHFRIRDSGLRIPTVTQRARDHDPLRSQECPHEVTIHGGNMKAFYVQCAECRIHVEY